jgi:hypothetical protein
VDNAGKLTGVYSILVIKEDGEWRVDMPTEV